MSRKGSSRSFARNFVTPVVRKAASYAFKQGVKRALNFSERKMKSKSRRMNNRRARRNYRPKKRTMKTKVDKLCQFVKSRCATHIRRQRDTSRCVAQTENLMPICLWDKGGTIADIETAMASLRYFDAGTNSMVVANPALGQYNRDIVLSIYRKLELRNNYHTAMKLLVYSCTPKTDTSVDPRTAFTDGLIEQGNPLPNTTSLLKFTDSHVLMDLWNVKRLVQKRLEPGQHVVVTTNTPGFRYDFATVDDQTVLYQKKYGGHAFIIRVEGVLGHDQTLVEIGVLPGGVDILSDITYKFTYDAGKDVHDVSYVDNSDSFTNIGRISQKPIAQQQVTIIP